MLSMLFSLIIKRIKKCSLLVLVILLNTTNFAAAVSDNDGTAFISKPEFESLKNSFQFELNVKNSNIDSKINNAIKEYLAGAKMTNRSKENVISYDKDGIVSIVDKATLPWTEGFIHFYGQKVLNRHNVDATIDNPKAWNSLYYVGDFRLTMDEKSWAAISPFKECSITDVDWVNFHAKWNGYCTTKYKFNFREYDFADTGWDSNYVSGKKVRLSPYSGWEIISSTRTETVNWASDSNRLIVHEGIGYDDSNIRINGWMIYTDQIFPSRNIIEKKNTKVISTKADNPMEVFVNYDGFYDFNNDTAPARVTHTWYKDRYTDIYGHIRMFGMLIGRKETKDSSGYVYGKTFDSDKTTDLNEQEKSLTFEMTDRYNATGSATDRRRYNPHIGFTYNYINNWNQLWTDAYDTYIEDMEKCDSSVNILKDKDEKKHLSINAGLPICKLNINYSIDIPLKFSDNKDHYVWIKTSTFSPTIDPQNDLNCITNFDRIMNNGVIDNTLLNTSLRCVKVPAGRTVTVTTKK